MTRLYRWITGLHFFVGVGAVFGGLAAVTDPIAPLGIPAETLGNGPFTDFFIPGLVLLVVLGLGNIATGVLVLRKTPYHGMVSAIGAAQGVLALLLMYKRDDFPMNVIARRLGR